MATRSKNTQQAPQTREKAPGRAKAPLAERLHAASASPTTKTPEPRQRRTSMPMRRPEHPDSLAGDKYTETMPIRITQEMRRALKLAQTEDNITAVARIRGMIELWMEGLPKEEGEPTGRYTAAVHVRARKHKG